MGVWVYRDSEATGMRYETRFAILYLRIKHIKNTKQLFCGNWLHKYCISLASLNLDCFSNVTSWSRTSIVNRVIIMLFNRISYVFSLMVAKHFLVQKAVGYNFCVIRRWIKNVFHQTHKPVKVSTRYSTSWYWRAKSNQNNNLSLRFRTHLPLTGCREETNASKKTSQNKNQEFYRLIFFLHIFSPWNADFT